MKKYLFYLLIGLAFSCNPVDCFKKTGNLTRESREIGAYHKIIINDYIDLYLMPGSGTGIIVEGGDKLMSKVKTTLEGDILKIVNDNDCNWARDYKSTKVYVYAQDLSRIDYLGYGNVYTQDSVVLNNNLYFYCEGTGDINLNLKAKELSIYAKSVSYILCSGTADKLIIETNNSLGKIYAEKMKATECQVTHNYINEIRVFPIQKLSATILNKGNVYYYNEPVQLVADIRGEGRLIKN